MANRNTLESGKRLLPNEMLRSKNQHYKLVMQADCNLVLYRVRDNYPLWNTVTYNKGYVGCYVIMQSDGNLVIYDKRQKPVWASNTYRNSDKYRLIMQNDGNLVIYTSGNQPIWASNTVQFEDQEDHRDEEVVEEGPPKSTSEYLRIGIEFVKAFRSSLESSSKGGNGASLKDQRDVSLPKDMAIGKSKRRNLCNYWRFWSGHNIALQCVEWNLGI